MSTTNSSKSTLADDDVVALPSPLDVSAAEKGSMVLFEKVNLSSESTSTNLEAQKQAAPASPGLLDPEDPHLVTWESPNDPTNPLNFKFAKKIWILCIVSTLTFIVPLASSMFAPGVPQLMREFNNTNTTLASFVVSIYILGFAIGPLIVAPLSEMYGRSIVYKVSTFMFTAFTVGAGECNNLVSMFVLRFLAGLIGSTSIALGSGSVADVMPIEKRGKYMSLYILGPVLGPCVGPIVGGFLAAVSWRWVFRVIGILSGVMTIVVFVFLPETYGPYILHVKANRLRKLTGIEMYHTVYEDRLSGPVTLFIKNIIRPCKLLILSPIVLIMSIYVAFTYGQLYLLFTTFTVVFEEQYGFSTNVVGLSYLGLGFGCLVSVLIIIRYSDRILVQMAAKSGEKKPEYRLPLLLILSPLNIIGLVMFAWTVQFAVHWIVPLIATFFIGVGVLATFSPTITYLVDAYTIYAASASSASSMVRSLGGAVLPLAGPPMYSALGYGWGNTLLAFIMLAITPLPLLMYFKGESLRKNFSPKLN
ncbi:major facilitator superfamily domain-containing protein [Lipomyces kononenkoae]|uniref:Major facilitator superfamily domain-containing protein n=1 Tax=Lipomyces kononenkoae TaxID=34357 RepID=A0ACC3SZA2_LIPKO